MARYARRSTELTELFLVDDVHRETVEHLTTEDDMAAYLEAVVEDGDPAPVVAALGDIARAEGMSQIARGTGLGRARAFTKRYHRTATRSSPQCSRSCARSASACTQRPTFDGEFILMDQAED